MSNIDTAATISARLTSLMSLVASSCVPNGFKTDRLYGEDRHGRMSKAPPVSGTTERQCSN